MQSRLLVLVSLVGLSSGCWQFHRLPSDEQGVSPSDGCSNGGCGAPTSTDDPFAQPRGCSARGASDNPGDKLCKAGTLEVNCVNAPPKIPCPASYRDAVRLACEQGSGNVYDVWCNACGGTTVFVPDKFYSFEMHYDASDQLLGVTLLEDQPVGPCEQNEFVFGRHCSRLQRSAELQLPCSEIIAVSQQPL